MPFFPKADPNDQNIAAARAKISGRIFPLLWNPILTNLGTMSNLLALSPVKFVIVKLFVLLVLRRVSGLRRPRKTRSYVAGYPLRPFRN